MGQDSCLKRGRQPAGLDLRLDCKARVHPLFLALIGPSANLSSMLPSVQGITLPMGKDS
jgi:hypothetical protein